MVTNAKTIQKLVIIYTDKILVVRRSTSDPARPNTWDFPGGNVDDGDMDKYEKDTLLSALSREVKEETGIETSIKDIKLIFLRSAKNMDKTGLVIWVGYQFSLDTETKIHLSSEHSEYKWVTLNEFQDLDFGFAKDDFIRTSKLIQFN